MLPGPPDSFLTGASDSGTWDIPDDLGPHGQFARSVPSRCALTAVLLTAKDNRVSYFSSRLSAPFSSSLVVAVVVVVVVVHIVSLRYRKRILFFAAVAAASPLPNDANRSITLAMRFYIQF